MLKINLVKDNSYKKLFSCLFFLLIFILNPSLVCFAQNNTIKIYADRSKGDVNYKIFGTNIHVHKTKYAPYNQNSDYGAGIWNPTEKKHNLPIINLAKDCDITFARYMSGNNHIWADAIGRRNTNHYGLDEFMQTCKILKAEPSIVLSYFTNSDFDSSNLVSYLNAKADDKLIKILQTESPLEDEQYTELFNKFVKKMPGINWSNYRAINGQITPYNVKYFEIGNEIYNSRYGISAESYAIKFAKFHQAMKSIDDTIKLGAVFHLGRNSWNKLG
jgi:alpha-L-arabinofuranosidase